MAVVREFMTSELVVVAPSATIAEAATLMGTNHVGSALVMDGDELLGIFTERDVLRAVASDFAASGRPVVEGMTASPETVTPDADAREALDTMLERGFRHFPVVEDDRVVGIVSMRDLTRGAR
jgi:CBS domain-containing protein